MRGARHASGWFGAILSLVFALGVASCGLVVSFDDFGTTARTTSPEAGVAATPYSVRGVASGLEGKNVTLLMKIHPPGAPIQVERMARDLEVGEGEFVFASALADGERYEITVRENPTGLSCSVDQGTGIVAGSDVGGVLVNCASSDALLRDLQVSGLPISPVFAQGVFQLRGRRPAFDVDVKVCDYFKPSDKPPAGEFGTSLAVSGDTMAAGSSKVVSCLHAQRQGLVAGGVAPAQPDIAGGRPPGGLSRGRHARRRLP